MSRVKIFPTQRISFSTRRAPCGEFGWLNTVKLLEVALALLPMYALSRLFKLSEFRGEDG